MINITTIILHTFSIFFSKSVYTIFEFQSLTSEKQTSYTAFCFILFKYSINSYTNVIKVPVIYFQTIYQSILNLIKLGEIQGFSFYQFTAARNAKNAKNARNETKLGIR